MAGAIMACVGGVCSFSSVWHDTSRLITQGTDDPCRSTHAKTPHRNSSLKDGSLGWSFRATNDASLF